MNNQVKQKFQEDFPLLMHQRDDNSFKRFGFEIGSGWYPLAYELFCCLEDLQRYLGEAVSISQVKEKFGSFRAYMGGGEKIEDEIDLLETIFESLSVRICDVCGEAGSRGSEDGYWCIRCTDHRMPNSEVIDGAIREAEERFLSYERQGVETTGFVHLKAIKSDLGEDLGNLEILRFPNRLTSLTNGLMEHLDQEDFSDMPLSDLAAIVVSLKGQGKILIGYTDGSEAGNEIMGRPV